MSFNYLVRNIQCSFKRCIKSNVNYLQSKPTVTIKRRHIFTTSPAFKKDKITVTFIQPNGDRITTTGSVGDSLLDVVVNNNIDLDGYGACEGTLTCSTCHLVLKKEDFDRLPDKPVDEEEDMLELAYGLTDTSRLGCQIILSEELDGLEVQVPATINDARS